MSNQGVNMSGDSLNKLARELVSGAAQAKSGLAAAKVAKVGVEGGHWYTRTGDLIEAMPKADGKGGMTKTTLRHARVHQLCPGITTIIGQSNREGLNIYRETQAIHSSLTLGRDEGEGDRSYLARIREDMRTAAKDARDKGTLIHAALDQSYRGVAFDPDFEREVAAVRRSVEENCGDQPSQWLPERAVVHGLGYATKVDLHSEHWVLDWKGHDGDQKTLDLLKTWDEHHMQLAAGREAIEGDISASPEVSPVREEMHIFDTAPLSRMRCAIVYVSRNYPGAVAFKEVPESKLRQGWSMFQHLTGYYYAKTGYRPSWAISGDDYR